MVNGAGSRSSMRSIHLRDLDLEPARVELAYARPVMERYIKRSQSDLFSGRKVAILTKVLENLN